MAEKRGGSVRKLFIAMVAAGLIFLGTLLGECGFGTGLGPGLKDQVPGATPESDAVPSASVAPSVSVAPSASAPAACVLRLDGEGIALEGKHVSVADAVAACKQAGKAELLTTGDARYGDHEKLSKALRDAGIFVLERQP